ncbi:MAG: ABC transporter permease [Actinomycetes bacterium]
MRRTFRVGGQYLVVLMTVIGLNFALPRLAPGDPIDYLVPPESGLVDPELRDRLSERYGLDGDNREQFGRYLSGLARGDLGVSVRDGRPVAEVLRQRIGWTVLLVGTAVVASTLLGVVLGFFAGWRRGSAWDVALLTGVLVVDALPAFFVGLLLLLAFSVELSWFPVYGVSSAAAAGVLTWSADVLHRLVLPAATLTLAGVGSVFVVARAAMLSETGEDHLFGARANGLDERSVRGRARRNALVPVSTVSLLGFSTLVGVAAVVETVFAYPGLGSLALDAVRARDYPVLQAVFLLFSVVAIGVNLLNDLLYPVLDPRVRRVHGT